MLDEGGLHRVQRFALGQPFDRGQFGAVVHHRQGQAAVDALAIEEHRAGAALAVVTALLGTGQVQLFAQQIEQRGPGENLDVAALAVQLEGDGTGGDPT